ncbi:hypothetical protein GYH30_013108 [Glycine max]|uniref:Alginate lyase 2 domain-containing protein n=1 Tax=Glycine max TaxID=3847 RepID=A0A0R0K2K4_SOYBN|nr:hypothetical protein GYH30_013108 [Glycine max]
MGALYQIVLLNIAMYFASVMHTTSRSMPLMPVDLTLGFTELSLNISNFKNHKPYNLPVRERYRFKNGVHKLWVHVTDKPLSPHSNTNPRSEIRTEGYDYSRGDASNVKIYVDGVQVYEAPGHGGSSHYSKFGVYTQHDPSCYMESRWKNIRGLTKSS